MMNNKYKVLICSVWAVLITYCIIKVFGGNYFELTTNSKIFIAVSNFIENNLIIKRMFVAIVSSISGYFIVCSIMKEKYLNWWQSLIFISLLLFKSLIQWKVKLLGWIIDLIILIVLPIILTKQRNVGTKILRPIIGSLLILAFQILSMFITNFALFKFNALHTLDALLYSLEYYFCIALYYLYSNHRKEGQ